MLRQPRPGWIKACFAGRYPDCYLVRPQLGSLRLTRHPHLARIRAPDGGVPKRSTGSDCKSDGSAFAGSNPAPSTNSCASAQEHRLPGVSQGRALSLDALDGCQLAARGCTIRPTRGCSSMVEPQPSKLMMSVRSRSPAPKFAHLAQSVEHTLGKGEVAGSIPVVGTIIHRARHPVGWRFRSCDAWLGSAL